MELTLPVFGGIIAGYAVRRIINWLSIDGYVMSSKDPSIELIGVASWSWAFLNLPLTEAILFSSIVIVLAGIAFVDFKTFQIPLIFILIGLGLALFGIVMDVIYISSALWGVFVGALIPLMIMGLLWMITKRQGMGFGDIQMGVVLGAWLGPTRMAITLFSASVLSLLTWIGVSIITDFDKDRAMPMAPFLSIAGTGTYVGSFYYPEFFHLLILQ